MKKSLLAVAGGRTEERPRAPQERDLIGNRKLLCGSWRRKTYCRSSVRSCAGTAAAAAPMMIRSRVVRGGLERARVRDREGEKKGHRLIGDRGRAASNLFDCLVIDAFNRGHLSRSISRAASEHKRVVSRRGSISNVQNGRTMPACTVGTPTFRSALAHGFQKWNAPSLSLFSIYARCGGHNDRRWSLCLSCKSWGNFERLSRPVLSASRVLPYSPRQNRWVGIG